MADFDDSGPPEQWGEIGKQIGIGVVDALARANVGDSVTAVIADALGKALAVAFKAVSPIGIGLAKGIAESEDLVGPELAKIAAAAASDVFGRDIPVSAFNKRRGRGGNADLSRQLGAGVIDTIKGQTGEIQPGAEGAQRYLGMVVNMALEGWYQGWFFEFMSSLVPYVDVGKIETFGELDDTLAQALGLGRLSRRVLGPIVDATCVKPFEWQCNKTYRPNLLSEGEILKAFNRGDYTGAEADEEFARLGYSPKRQDILVKSAAKRLSIDDVLTLVRDGALGRDYAIQNLRDEGWDQATAELAVTAAEVKRFNAVNDNSLSALTRAFTNRDIPDGAFESFLHSIIKDDLERGSFLTAAQTQRELNIRHLSSAEVIDCVELGILPTAYYRDWLEREGYPEDEGFALELRLRARLDENIAIADHRKALERERAEAKQAKADAAKRRLEQLEAERQLHQRGSIADLSRAVVRGLIGISRLEDVLRVQYDADTVAILVGLVEQDRQAYLDQQQAAADAKQRASRRNVDVGALEAAVLADVLTAAQFTGRLRDMGFSPADAELLTATLVARKADRDAAEAKHAQAEEAAKRKSIDLGRAERLVRRGNWSLGQYDALLASLGFDEPARAAMVDLLQGDIADDAAARKVRDEAAKKAAVKGLSLEQMRRAVIIEAATDAQFQAYLVNQGYTLEAQVVLLAELRRDVADADAARLKREAAERASAVAALPLSRAAHAARLGVITPAAYQVRLRTAGYSDDDVAIEMELLVVEIADAQAARAKRDALAATTDAPRALSLAQLERAVKAGAATLDDYRLAAAAIYAADDVALLAGTLAAELATLDDARARHTTLTGELAARTLSLGDLEAAVKAGAVSVAAYRAQLVSWGYGPDDADLLTFLLSEKLNAAPGGL